MAKKQQRERKFYITLEVEMDSCYDYDENEARKICMRIADEPNRHGKNDKYYVQSIRPVSIIDEKGGMLWNLR